MNYQLRKVHKYSWLFIVIILPILILLSIKDLDFSSAEKNPSNSINSSTKHTIKIAENELVKVAVLSKENIKSVEVVLKSSLKSSSSLVYALNTKGEKGSLIGSLSNVGIYKFNFQEPLNGIVIYDTLKETLITKLIF